MHNAMMDLIPMIDADTDAFTEFVNASRMPKETPEQVKVRDAAMEEGLKTAIKVPLKVMEIGDSCWDNMEELAKYGNMSSVSDLEVGARSLELGIWGAYRNVVVNERHQRQGMGKQAPCNMLMKWLIEQRYDQRVLSI